MNTKNYNKSEVVEFINEGKLCNIIEINGEKYAQVSEIHLLPKQIITVVELYGSETFVIVNGQAVVEIPDEGRYFGVLVEGRNGPRWSQFLPSDVAIKISSGWDANTTSDWIESQFDR